MPSHAICMDRKYFAAAHAFSLFFLHTSTHAPQKHFLFGWNYAPKKGKAGAAGATAAAGGKGGARLPNKAPAAAPAATAAASGGGK